MKVSDRNKRIRQIMMGPQFRLMVQEYQMKLLTPTARRILEDLDSLTYLMERGDGRVRPQESSGDYWEVGAEELASAAFLSRRLGRLLTRLEKKGEKDLQETPSARADEPTITFTIPDSSIC